ncbi:alpha-L-fucosidase [Paenibacillus sp. LS1]|uniref:alpha-L-fucosidase n=1 Tax=Paenibacillus sp. LS1 TaxID=2992120 RepID=UPI00222E3BD9|nr:alpha-L-fucosidase [Paenibacillus sp. LS1]MCW3791901.1 alpha-L-fucosidase [Paenibacillus sp. LS1]
MTTNMAKIAALVTPSERQISWNEMEFYGFIHFTVNTFTNQEWGDGSESPAIFNPTAFDAHQWVDTCKLAGMSGLILTCKHHDGFNLWPTQLTEHSVKNSPWRDGRGDMVKEVADACREGGIKFGVYLSPWDRHEPSYGDSEVYNEFFVGQLKELLTGYGEIFCVWFDGACGEGPNGKKQVYDWDRYYEVIRELQPNAVISVCGPDVRWCGNEAGHTRTSEWSVVPASMLDNEKIQENSQQVDDGMFAKRVPSQDEDLGSRGVVEAADGLAWYPAEVNTSIRPGWFYHPQEDDQVRSTDELLDIYYGSVGGNGTFLLNLPPTPSGRIHEHDVQRMKELGDVLRHTFATDLAVDVKASCSSMLDEHHHANRVVDERTDTWWSAPEGMEEAWIELDLGEEHSIDHAVLMEHIRSGQRIERFRLECRGEEEEWTEISSGTVVGYKKILRFPAVHARFIRLMIEESRWCPTLQKFGVYYAGKNC